MVPHRAVQIEFGTTYENLLAGFRVSGPEMLIRYGLSRRVELRLGVPDFARESYSGHVESDVGSTNVSAKFALGSLAGVGSLALIPGLSVSLGNGALTSQSVDPELKLVSSKDLGTFGDLSFMSYGQWTSDTSGRFLALQQTASASHDLTQRVTMFLEYSGMFQPGTSPDHVAHTGITVAIGSLQAVDVHGGLSLNGEGRNPFLGLGFSKRF